MSIVPVHTRKPLPPSMQAVYDLLPDTWVDDGLTDFPDSILGWSIAPAGTVHDARYCTRLWAAGTLDEDWKEKADLEIRDNVWALLPVGLRYLAYVVFLGVWRGGYGPFDSCGLHPHSATAGQIATGLCRHGVPIPPWMRPSAA